MYGGPVRTGTVVAAALGVATGCAVSDQQFKKLWAEAVKDAADQRQRADKLEAALKWALEEGVVTSKMLPSKFFDAGCGCCKDEIEPPPELAGVIAEAIK